MRLLVGASLLAAYADSNYDSNDSNSNHYYHDSNDFNDSNHSPLKIVIFNHCSSHLYVHPIYILLFHSKKKKNLFGRQNKISSSFIIAAITEMKN